MIGHCPTCEEEFEIRNARQRFCSAACRHTYARLVSATDKPVDASEATNIAFLRSLVSYGRNNDNDLGMGRDAFLALADRVAA